jgi:hypothetical protein
VDRVARSVLKPWNASGACSWVSMMIGKLMFIDRIEFDALCDTLRQNFLYRTYRDKSFAYVDR